MSWADTVAVRVLCQPASGHRPGARNWTKSFEVVRYLDGLNPSAARSLEEGLDETLTLHRLGIPDLLPSSLNSTNIIESSLSRVDHMLQRVKRCNGGDHVQR